MTASAIENYAPIPEDARILVVDDDPAMRKLITGYFNDHNLSASATGDRRGLMLSFGRREPDLIILDLHLGQDDGLDILREIRTRSVIPVIIVTGNRRDEIDQILGLELGADDYVTKPFSVRELLARSRAVLRRRTMDRINNGRQRERSFRFDGWHFDQRWRQLTAPSGETVTLTKSEFALLSAFVRSPRQVLTREHLLHATRVHEDVYDRSMDVQILRLRRKLKDASREPRIIRTERGVGYRFDVDVEVT